MMDFAQVHNAYVYVRDPADPANMFHARMFAPTAGTPEDPATGSASCLFAAQLLASGELAEGLNIVALRQGEDMGRPSKIALEVDVAAGRLAAVRLAGTSVTVTEGWLEAE